MESRIRRVDPKKKLRRNRSLLSDRSRTVRPELRARVPVGKIDRQALPPYGPRRRHNALRPDQAGSIPWLFTLGYVGRLTVEKNVRLLVELEKALLEPGCKNFRFLIVGQEVLEPWLRKNLHHGTFAGVLKGDALARAYANMDVFTFPSRTDTFGNVVLEALASGVPAVVTNEGGPKFIIRNGETGFPVSDVREFSAAVG
jgi:glycosyltransferase involved in cell wall biosynthesis